jgi:hypothetical protein
LAISGIWTCSIAFSATTTRPATPIRPIPFSFVGGFGEQKPRKKKSKYGLYYQSDFTSKILGLKPMKIKQVNMNKLVRQLQTGLEIRKGVIPE